MAQQAPAWVVPVMRAGYSARALVYTVVGSLALAAAIDGGSAEGTTGALADLKSEPFGVALLWVIAIGLLAYAVWRFIAAALDLERRGDDSSGLFARGGLVVTGLIHAALGVSVGSLAMGRSGGGGDSGAQDWTARLMQLPYGKWIAAAIAAGIIGAGIYYIHKGMARKYERTMRVTPTTRKLDPALMAGFVAQGTLIAIVGALLGYAALTADPSEAGGIGAALDQVRSAPFGRVALGVIAVGVLGFALENLVEARYRIVPARSGGEVETLAARAKAKAKAKAEETARAAQR
ncbi:hypothetical protein ROJ8625_01390 [Roseivivax jejudonensis]|uniref:DUF1206 domain-containing protein n=1 Tax=Roseivivax jejudonensis TaxID=1529041 RepID=A0A1X6YU83_9RHOB|nr:DUF1206 domain-containing protein [Roseivivax jejudonensis]SLN30826.1 hypothetical protein ROJ8625_01390 [Roseivivax jejudonensis]